MARRIPDQLRRTICPGDISWPAQATPNAITVSASAQPAGRGSPNWWEQLPIAATAPKLSDSRQMFDKDLRNPYTERWSFGVQRQVSANLLVDMSYIGTVGHELPTKEDLNPRLPNGDLLYPAFGPASARTNQGNSASHALQARVDRRL